MMSRRQSLSGEGSRPRSPVCVWAGRLLWPLPALFAWLAQRWLAENPAFTETIHARYMFRWLSRPIAAATSLLPFSITELLAAAAVLFLPLLLLIWLIRLFRRPDRLNRAGRLLRRAAWTASLLYLVFMLLHGFNYARQPLAVTMDLPSEARPLEDLTDTTAWLIDQTLRLRETRPENEDGSFAYQVSRRDMLKKAVDGYAAAAYDYPLLSGPNVRPKPVQLSHLWSYTGITGMYFPFLVEANVNIDTPPDQIMFTTLHEVAHLRGFAREDEANFLAFITGLYHPDADFTYAALLSASDHCLNAVYRLDPAQHAELASRLSDPVRRDLTARSLYWKQFEGPVQTASTKVNHAYLQANLQTDGVHSYGRMVDLVIAWHGQAADNGALAEWQDRLAAFRD